MSQTPRPHGHYHDDNESCVEYVDQIVYLVDNELDESDVVAVRVHIQDCRPCHERYEVQRSVKAIVARSCAEKAPDDLRARIMITMRTVSQTSIGQRSAEPGLPEG